MFPVASLYGTDFYPIAFLDTSLKILAARDKTSVTVDDSVSTTTYSLQSGEVKELQSSQFALSAYHVTSNNPISVVAFGGQFSTSPGVVFGGATSMQTLPTAAFKKEFRIPGPADQLNFVILVAPSAAVPSVAVNGTLISIPFLPLPGGLYQWTYYPVIGQTVVTANAPIGLYAVGLGVLGAGGSFAYPGAF